MPHNPVRSVGVEVRNDSRCAGSQLGLRIIGPAPAWPRLARQIRCCTAYRTKSTSTGNDASRGCWKPVSLRPPVIDWQHTARHPVAQATASRDRSVQRHSVHPRPTTGAWRSAATREAVPGRETERRRDAKRATEVVRFEGGSSSDGGTSAFQAEGRGFNSRLPLQPRSKLGKGARPPPPREPVAPRCRVSAPVRTACPAQDF